MWAAPPGTPAKQGCASHHASHHSSHHFSHTCSCSSSWGGGVSCRNQETPSVTVEMIGVLSLS